jgi:hypothetical protein
MEETPANSILKSDDYGNSLAREVIYYTLVEK